MWEGKGREVTKTTAEVASCCFRTFFSGAGATYVTPTTRSTSPIHLTFHPAADSQDSHAVLSSRAVMLLSESREVRILPCPGLCQ